MSDNPSEAEKQMENKIFISGDAWLCVFDLLPPRQLGLQIALISHRFDAMVEEHFKTRRRALEFIRIGHQIGEDGNTETQIVNAHGQPLPMPAKPMPNKVIAFNCILINYLDRNGMAFLEHFRRLFTTCGTLAIKTNCARLLDFILRNIPSTAGVHANSPSSAVAASDHQPLMLKWLCAPSPRSRDANILPPKMLSLDVDTEWTVTTINQIKAAFLSASSPATFVCVFRDPRFEYWFEPIYWGVFYGHWTNGRTEEQLIIERRADDYLLLVRCPISRDSDKWTTWEDEAIGWFSDEPLHQRRNRIIVCMRDERSVGDNLLDNNNDDAAASDPGPSVQQQLQAESVYDDENEMNQDDDNDEEDDDNDSADDSDDDDDDINDDDS